jgi:hypothetical protein
MGVSVRFHARSALSEKQPFELIKYGFGCVPKLVLLRAHSVGDICIYNFGALV